MLYKTVKVTINKRLNSRRMRIRLRVNRNPTAHCVVYSTLCYIMYVRLHALTRHSKHVAAALGAGGMVERW